MRRHMVLAVLVGAVLFATLGRLQAGAARVDVALVLAIDSSSSVSADEFYLQTQGLAAAFADPEVEAAITRGTEGAIAVAILEWAGPDRQEVNLVWTTVRPADLPALSAELADLPRLIDGGGTGLGAGLLAATALFAQAPPATRRVIDVSGDGRTSAGPPVAAARDAAVAAGITVNGLAIVNEEPDLEAFYRDNLKGGPDAFVMRARDYEDFTRAIKAKLLRELENSPLLSGGATGLPLPG
jgi:hypothetical protein